MGEGFGTGVLQLNNNGAVASTASITEFPDKETNCFLVDPIRNLITTSFRQKTNYIFIRSCSCERGSLVRLA